MCNDLLVNIFEDGLFAAKLLSDFPASAIRPGGLTSLAP